MKHRITSMFGIALIAAMASSSMARLAQAAGYTAFVEIRPVAPLGTGAAPYPAGTTIDGNSITVPAGTRVWFDVYIGGWAPDLLESFGAAIYDSYLTNGQGAPLQFVLENCPAADSASPYCADLFGVGCGCTDDPEGLYCDLSFLDPSRTLITELLLLGPAIPFSDPEHFGISTFYSYLPDEGDAYLVQSFVLDVPSGAAGTYTVPVSQGPDTYFITDAGFINIGTYTPAVVNVLSPCCLPGGACSYLANDMCANAGGTVSDHCWGDCDMDGIDDACEAFDDCDGNNVPDACELDTHDCNHNGLVDACDVAAGADDCNADNIPDVCELGPNDCDGNGIPDDCQSQDDCDGNGALDVCEFAAGNAADCNGNGVLDACDINAGTSTDANGDCIPDECDAMAGPIAEVNGHPENRFLSFSTAGAGCRDMAVRVELVSLNPPGRGNDFAAFVGKWRWLGPPVMKSYMMNDGPEYDMMTQLQCDPYVQDWSTVGMVHAYGAEVMPESTYAVSFYDASCGDVNNPSCYSNELVVHTAKWADLAPSYDGETEAVEPDIADVAALVDKFLGHSWPTRPEADLAPNIPNLDIPIDFNDISTAVDAYLGQPYPFAGPVACPFD